MLNFRKLRRDFSTTLLQEGKEMFEQGAVVSAKIIKMDRDTVRLSARIKGMYDNTYESEIEIDRNESDVIDSNCDCTYNYDCHHIVVLLFYVEKHFNEMVVSYSRETDLECSSDIDEEVKRELKETFEVAANKEEERRDQQHQRAILRDYIQASQWLSSSPFCIPFEDLKEDSAELAIIFLCDSKTQLTMTSQAIEFQLVLYLPSRSKPLYISNIKSFLEGVHYQEPVILNGRRYCFSLQSFNSSNAKILDLLLRYVRYANNTSEEKFLKTAFLAPSALGTILSHDYEKEKEKITLHDLGSKVPFKSFFLGNLEKPLFWSSRPVKVDFVLDCFENPYKALLITPSLILEEERISPEAVFLMDSDIPGLIFDGVYYQFNSKIKRSHLRSLLKLCEIFIPEALLGSFVENTLPILKNYAELSQLKVLKKFSTLPYVEKIKGECEMSYLDGELEARLYFLYNDIKIPASPLALTYKDIKSFINEKGILARNLVEEKKLLENIFSEFLYDERTGAYHIKSEKRIVDFMTETIPTYQDAIVFHCPENLSKQFIYDETTFDLHFRESTTINFYEIELKVNGLLKDKSLDLLWDCISVKKSFLELPVQGCSIGRSKKIDKAINRSPKILVLDLEKLVPLVQIFNELGFKVLDDVVLRNPLWSLANISSEQFAGLPVSFSMTDKLLDIQAQIRGEKVFENPQKIPEIIQANLRKYQVEGVQWLERLRRMNLNGILADDMGLGKTLQAIIAITQSKVEKREGLSLIICPTSLVYNWKEEFRKFNPELKVLVVDGIPSQRKKQLMELSLYDVVVTSYNLLQKDIDAYKQFIFDYVVLDEAHHIKNRTTRNAKSVKMIQAEHRLILTGTPIENSLEELWSLFDFLMPGLLSTYDRFVSKYIRVCGFMGNKSDNMVALKKKVAPFILRRMKEDVLDDLPPVSEIIYHCHLTDSQKELYQSYAASAKLELSKLVKREGFDKIHIHVLATLTRLKQICCHPAIFAKEQPSIGDSAKYDMLMDLLASLIEGGHKTVVFSQYTKMLGIIRQDLEKKGIKFSYLDGSTKNRLEIVNQFNEDPSVLVFLVSLKAGGTGLNLVGADTVIHYDMWWNPAVENQATDRVRRIGQQRSVSSYKLVTLNTIEEKILTLQNRKKSLVKKVINSDDEVISKLTWEEVLELLQV